MTRSIRLLFLIAITIIFALIASGCLAGNAAPTGLPTPTRFVLPPTWTPGPTHTPTPTPTLVLGDAAAIAARATVTPRPTATRAPGGGTIAFASDRTGKSDIYIMDADGTNVRRITDSPEPETNPAWSPDGNQLAFMAYTKEGSTSSTPRAKIFLVNGDGTDRRMLIQGLAPDLFPAWSPNGEKIAYEGQGGISTVLANGQRVQTIATSTEENLGFPKWSPDGTGIVYSAETLPAVAKARGKPAESKIYVADSRGGAQRFLTNGSMPSWSPDGRRIAFVSFETGVGQIFVIDSDGRNRTQLTTGATGNVAPDWSPDGSQIVFQSGRDGNSEIYVMNADGSNQTDLTRDRSDDSSPAWLR